MSIRGLKSLPQRLTIAVLGVLTAANTPTGEEETEDQGPTAFADRMVACAVEEMGALTDDEQAVIIEYAPDLARTLGPVMAPSECPAGSTPSEACEAALGAISCEALASGLRTAGYDQVEAPALDPALLDYVNTLAMRVMTCAIEAPSDELAKSLTDLANARLGLAVASALATERCTLDGQRLATCVDIIDDTPCAQLFASGAAFGLENVMGACDNLFVCEPAEEPTPTPE
jgi:hypothetical protein